MFTTPTLPPTARDFEIHRLHLVQHFSTWRLAEKYEISQTRVRQIIKAVSEWLAVTLQAKNEIEQEQETRLAQHIAADQLNHQIEQLQTYFDGSGDPKYLRQQSRAILSLARLGIIPGSIDSLAADIEHQTEAQARDSQYKPEAQARDSIPVRPAAAVSSLSPDSCPLTPFSSPPPPLGDCSPNTTSHHSQNSPPETEPAPTPFHAETSRQISFPYDDALAGLCLMEKNLLTLLENTLHDEPDRLESLNYSLSNVRRQKASLQLRLSPSLPGALLSTDTPDHSPSSFNPQPQAQAPASSSFNPQPQAQAPAQLET